MHLIPRSTCAARRLGEVPFDLIHLLLERCRRAQRRRPQSKKPPELFSL